VVENIIFSSFFFFNFSCTLLSVRCMFHVYSYFFITSFLHNIQMFWIKMYLLHCSIQKQNEQLYVVNVEIILMNPNLEVLLQQSTLHLFPMLRFLFKYQTAKAVFRPEKQKHPALVHVLWMGPNICMNI
jgi:hypothetical protein